MFLVWGYYRIHFEWNKSWYSEIYPDSICGLCIVSMMVTTPCLARPGQSDCWIDTWPRLIQCMQWTILIFAIMLINWILVNGGSWTRAEYISWEDSNRALHAFLGELCAILILMAEMNTINTFGQLNEFVEDP